MIGGMEMENNNCPEDELHYRIQQRNRASHWARVAKTHGDMNAHRSYQAEIRTLDESIRSLRCIVRSGRGVA